MSDVKRVWTAEEILGELPGYKKTDDPGHDAMLEEAAAHWARCTQLMAAFKRVENYCAAIGEEGDK